MLSQYLPQYPCLALNSHQEGGVLSSMGGLDPLRLASTMRQLCGPRGPAMHQAALIHQVNDQESDQMCGQMHQCGVADNDACSGAVTRTQM